jgi:hypothetical protein
LDDLLPPLPSETEITGRWLTDGGRTIADGPCRRIDALRQQYLEQIEVDGSGWETLFRDPADGRFWELIYPRSEKHGGGPPTLRVITLDVAKDKYGRLLE